MFSIKIYTIKYTLPEIMKKFGKNTKYYRVDLVYFADGAKKSVIDYMGKNKFPAYLIVNKKGNHANTYKIKVINKAYKWMHKDD
jgi:hypothetical protein